MNANVPGEMGPPQGNPLRSDVSQVHSAPRILANFAAQCGKTGPERQKWWQRRLEGSLSGLSDVMASGEQDTLQATIGELYHAASGLLTETGHQDLLTAAIVLQQQFQRLTKDERECVRGSPTCWWQGAYSTTRAGTASFKLPDTDHPLMTANADCKSTRDTICSITWNNKADDAGKQVRGAHGFVTWSSGEDDLGSIEVDGAFSSAVNFALRDPGTKEEVRAAALDVLVRAAQDVMLGEQGAAKELNIPALAALAQGSLYYFAYSDPGCVLSNDLLRDSLIAVMNGTHAHDEKLKQILVSPDWDFAYKSSTIQSESRGSFMPAVTAADDDAPGGLDDSEGSEDGSAADSEGDISMPDATFIEVPKSVGNSAASANVQHRSAKTE